MYKIGDIVRMKNLRGYRGRHKVLAVYPIRSYMSDGPIRYEYIIVRLDGVMRGKKRMMAGDYRLKLDVCTIIDKVFGDDV